MAAEEQVIYTYKEQEEAITNTVDYEQGVDSPRWTPEFWAVQDVRTLEYWEGADTIGWPAKVNYEIDIVDDLVKKYWAQPSEESDDNSNDGEE